MPRVTLDEFFAANDPLKPPAARNTQRTPEGFIRVSPETFFGQAETPEEEPGLVGGALKRGTLGLQSDFTATAGLAAQAFGYDEAAQGFYNRAKELSEEAGSIKRKIGGVEEIKSLLDVGTFALESIIENAPLLASIAIPGLTAAKLTGLVARKAAQKAGRVGLAEAAKIAGKQRAVGTFAAFLSDVGLQTGESANIVREAGGDPLDIRVVGSGLGKGALDFVPIAALAKKIGLLKGIPFGKAFETQVGKELVDRGFIRTALGNAATLVAFEVPTEVSQEIINIALDRSISQFEGQLTPEEKSQLLNAAGGAAAFGLLGVPAAAFRPRGGEVRPATDAELNASDNAPGPPPGPLLLPAPAIRITPGGTAILPGATHQTVKAQYDPALDTPKTGSTVAEGVKRALEIEQVPVQPNVFSVTEEGVVPPQAVDPHATAADDVRQIAEQLRTPLQQSVVAIDDARAASIMANTDPIPLDTEAKEAYPFVVKVLLEARDDTFSNPNNRRSADGQLTKAAEAQIKRIDKRLALITKQLGLAEPFELVRLFNIKDANELSQINAEEEARRAERPDQRLTNAESALLTKLEEKEFERELTLAEEGIREKLLAKREGEEEVDRKKLSAEEVAQLRKDGAEIGDDESEQVRLRRDELQVKLLAQVSKEAVQAQTDRITLEKRIEQLDTLEERIRLDGVDVSDDKQVEAYFQDLLFRNILDKNSEIKITPSQRGVAFPERVSAFALTRGESPATPKRLLQQFRAAQTEAFGLRAKLQAQIKKEKELARRQTVLNSNPETARFREGEGKGLSVEVATDFIRKVAAKLVNGPEFIVVDLKDSRLFEGTTRKRATSARAKGAFFTDEPNRVYIFANNNRSLADLTQTFLHETLAHFGMRAFYTEEEMNSILESIYKSRGKEIQDKFGVPKSQTEAMKFAEEYIGEIAENGLDQTFLNRIIAFIRRAFRKIFPKTKFTDNDIVFMLRDIGSFLTGQIPGRNPAGFEQAISSDVFMREAGRNDIESVLPPLSSWRDVWGAKFQTWFLTPLQIADNSNIPGTKEYLELVQLWAARKNTLIRVPDDIAKRWLALPRKEGQILAQVLLETMEASELAGRSLTQEEEIAIMKKNGASQNVFNMYKEVRKSFDEIINLLQDRLEFAAIRDAVKNFQNPKEKAKRLHELWKQDRSIKGSKIFVEALAADKALEGFSLGAKLINITNEMQVLRDQNYFPRMRFGQYAIIVRAEQDLKYKGKEFRGPRDGKLGEVINYETFEDPGSRKARRPGVDTQFKDTSKFKVAEGYVSDEEFSFLGMPPALFDILKTDARLNLSEVQVSALTELYFRYSPGRAFLKHLTQRKGIDGYNTDAIRVYANYMMNAASHIARVEFAEDMQIQQKVMRNVARDAPDRQGTRAGIIAEYFNKHFKYIMNPENDLASLRAMGFLFYLGFNVKSAAVNLTQVPMVAYPFLAQNYGDGAAIAAITRAYGAVSKRLTGRAIYDQETDEAVTRGIEEGFLDESLVTELAAIGEGDVLQRIMPENANIRLLNKVSYYGSFLFRHAEKINREIVFIAARELALRKTPGDQEAAFRAGRKAVQATMFEYKKWNRPAFMRGKKSVFFLFWQYMQHLSFIAYGGEGKTAAMRIWGMLLFTAGIQGLPFMENIFDVLDFGGTQAKEALKMKDPKVNLRDDLRELVRNLTDKPDIVMHGMSRYYGLGPMHLLSALGVPVPATDISGSLSAGKVIPGTKEFLGPSDDPTAKFGRTIIEAMGPVAGVGYNIWKAMESNDPDLWKVWERAMPTALQGASKAIRRSSRGEENFRGGGAVAKFDPHDPEQFLEAVAQAFSFATTRVNQRFELRASQEGMKQYWVVRRTKVMENYAWAILQEDPKVLAVALKRLTLFNKQAPAPGLRISGKNLRDSVRARFRRGYLREKGIPNERAFRSLYMNLQENFPEGAPDTAGR